MKSEFYSHNEAVFDLHLVMCGKEKCPEEFKMPPHMREYYLIHYIQQGTVILEVNGKKYKAEEGDIFVIYPDTLSSYYNACGDNSLEFCWIGFVGDAAERYLEYAGVTSDNPVIHIHNSDFDDSVLRLVKLFEKNRQPSEFTLNCQLLKCFYNIEKSIKPHKKEMVNYVDIVLAYIDDNYMKNISSADIVDFVNLNRSYLFKIFKKQTGLSVSQYLIKYRMDKACEFFDEYNFNISRVAQMVGIGDVYYFSKLFKKIKGITPSGYKKRQDS